MSKRNRIKKRDYRDRLNNATSELNELKNENMEQLKESINKWLDLKKIALNNLTDDDVIVVTIPYAINMASCAINVTKYLKKLLPNSKNNVVFLPEKMDFSVEKRDELIERLKNINIGEES